MLADDSKMWICPKCGAELTDFIGPASKKLTIDNHNYWVHERPDKLQEEAQRVRDVASRYVPGTSFDADFYEGRLLTTDDHSMLSLYQVCWEKPLDKRYKDLLKS